MGLSGWNNTINSLVYFLFVAWGERNSATSPSSHLAVLASDLWEKTWTISRTSARNKQWWPGLGKRIWILETKVTFYIKKELLESNFSNLSLPDKGPLYIWITLTKPWHPSPTPFKSDLPVTTSNHTISLKHLQQSVVTHVSLRWIVQLPSLFLESSPGGMDHIMSLLLTSMSLCLVQCQVYPR